MRRSRASTDLSSLSNLTCLLAHSSSPHKSRVTTKKRGGGRKEVQTSSGGKGEENRDSKGEGLKEKEREREISVMREKPCRDSKVPQHNAHCVFKCYSATNNCL